MVTESRLDAQRLLTRWVLATFGGWLLGIVAVILLAEISEGMHIGNQFRVGLGMGWGVGFAQWRVARKWFGATSAWMWVSAAAMGLPFVLSDITGIMWGVKHSHSLWDLGQHPLEDTHADVLATNSAVGCCLGCRGHGVVCAHIRCHRLPRTTFPLDSRMIRLSITHHASTTRRRFL
jgi:hypothetical protein